MSQEPKKAGIDYSSQFKLEDKLSDEIFQTVKEIADERLQNNMQPNDGLLIIIGDFYREGFPHGKQFATNPFKGKYITAEDEDFKDRLKECMENDYDGAVIIDRTGQLLGARVYVEITDLSIDYEVNGTRHLAAVSGSTLEEVISTISLSQTTNKVTMYRDGKEDKLYEAGICKKS